MNLSLSNKPFYVKLACTLVSIISLIYIAIIGKNILSPLIFSFLFSVLLVPYCTFLEKRLRLPRSISSLLSVITLLAFVVLLLFVIGSQMGNFADDWPQFKEQILNSLNGLQQWINDRFHIDKAHQLDYINSAATKFLSSGTAVLGATVLSLSGLLLFVVFVCIYTFFFLLYRKLILSFLVRVFAEQHNSTVLDIVQQTQYIIRKYLIGLLLQMLIVGVLSCLAFWILGIKYSFLLGLITGVFNVIPYIGIFSSILLACLITFATAASLTKVLFVLVALVVIHLIDSNIVLPVVVGSKVKINALITVLGIFSGEMIWGISGMFLSIPILAVLKIIFDRVDDLKPWGILLGEEQKK